MDRRVVLLGFAALVIVGLCSWKLTRPKISVVAPRELAENAMPAPDFELADQGADLGSEEEHRSAPSRRVRLRTYLGRHLILLAFFNDAAGADRDPILTQLRTAHESLKANDVIVLAVSTALPQENRAAIRRGGPYPFPLLTDLDGTVCAAWGCLNVRDDGSRETRSALFVIDRAGRVGWGDRLPQPDTHPEQTIASLSAEK